MLELQFLWKKSYWVTIEQKKQKQDQNLKKISFLHPSFTYSIDNQNNSL